MSFHRRMGILFVFLVVIVQNSLIIQGHLSIWTKSMFGADPSNPNSNRAALPLQDYTFDQWWWHGNLDQPPPPGEIFNLPANGKADVEIAGNKAFTSMGQGLRPNPREAPVPWINVNGWGNMHAVERVDVAGCAFGIAYKSQARDVKPEDFVIFSVVHDCPARQLQSFDIPDLPACPNGQCMCSWFWIHESRGGSDQMYMTPFICNVTNVSNTKRKIGTPKPPIKCDRHPFNCVKGPKSPMYWKNKEGNNMLEPGHQAPTYSRAYGFAAGAQNDIFV